jgi:hypothetical protein
MSLAEAENGSNSLSATENLTSSSLGNFQLLHLPSFQAVPYDADFCRSRPEAPSIGLLVQLISISAVLRSDLAIMRQVPHPAGFTEIQRSGKRDRLWIKFKISGTGLFLYGNTLGWLDQDCQDHWAFGIEVFLYKPVELSLGFQCPSVLRPSVRPSLFITYQPPFLVAGLHRWSGRLRVQCMVLHYPLFLQACTLGDRQSL